jgi:small-conductance mechanosensitive channel
VYQIVAKMIPWPLGIISSLFTNNSKKWRDLGKQLEIPATLFFWTLGLETSFLPIMNTHIVPGYTGDSTWKGTMNKVIVTVFVGTTLNFFEKIIIQLIAIGFHLRTYADRIELSRFQINSLVKLYQYSKLKLAMEDSDFEEDVRSGAASGARTPAHYVEKAQKTVAHAFHMVGDVAGKVAGDFTGKYVTKSTHPHSVVLTLLNTTSGSQVLARRLYRTFVQEGTEMVVFEDTKMAFDNDEEASAAFSMFDKDMNGDISLEEWESVCVEIGRERKSITASLKDLDSVVSKLDGVLVFLVVIITVLVLITLLSTSAAGVLTSAGSTVLALSWLFSATAQEFLQSLVFVFVKHPFDVGDRVTVYGNTGPVMKGDDYFVKEISLLYTEFKKMEGHLVQAPNSYLNTLFILNMRRSGGLAEGVPLTVKFGTTLEQIDQLRSRLLEFVKAEKREYQGNILTEIRDVVEVYSVNLNVVFFYKSNWQNEGLRLQRRNKFICAMMVAMQDIGIEGPRLNAAGQKESWPFYGYTVPTRAEDSNPATSDVPGPRSGSVSSHDPRNIPFVSDGSRGSLRRSGSNMSNTNRRDRGESISAMSKRLDFSLGMKDVSSSDMAGDVYDDSSSRVPEITRSYVARSASIRNRTSPVLEVDEGEEDGGTLGRTTSRDTDSRSRFRIGRYGSQSHLGKSTSSVHRNRFFGTRGRGESLDTTRQDLMEQGKADVPEIPENENISSEPMDPSAGLVSPQAFRMDTRSSEGAGTAPSWEAQNEPTPTQAQGFEMRRLM